MTEATLRVPGYEGLWALGDCAAVPSPAGMPYAPTAQNALRQAVVCADNIVAAVRGEGTAKPFVFNALGKLASLGGRSAVAEILGVNCPASSAGSGSRSTGPSTRSSSATSSS